MIEPQTKSMEHIDNILTQNQQILSMNERLLAYITTTQITNFTSSPLDLTVKECLETRGSEFKTIDCPDSPGHRCIKGSCCDGCEHSKEAKPQ